MKSDYTPVNDSDPLEYILNVIIKISLTYQAATEHKFNVTE